MVEASLKKLRERADSYSAKWHAQIPFRYVVMDDFLDQTLAEAILTTYPQPDVEGWDQTTYIHQRKKFTLRSNFPEPAATFFTMTESQEFRDLISKITGIPDLISDHQLFGGGLHQIIRGGFLDVHVDYNLHPETKTHRRLNLLVYLNKDWKTEYEGFLELWDLPAKKMLDKIAPIFNRAVMFETNEISYHGHPKPLNTPSDVTRKSLAIYYYTTEIEKSAPEHNTLYKQTTGLHGYWKTWIAASISTIERVRSQGWRAFAENILRRTKRSIRGLPPENK